jgi:hypothetical protein
VVEMSEITRKPSPLGSSLSLLTATVGLGGAALGAPGALAPAALGVLLVGLGLVRVSRRLVTLGGAALFAGVVLAGVQGAPPESLLLSTLGAVLAWDVADHAIGVGEHLGREADTRRVELVHAATSLLVGVFGAGVCFATYVVAAGGQPVSALVLLLLGAVALVAALRGGGRATSRY